jgi:retron-type reverse transcriptase
MRRVPVVFSRNASTTAGGASTVSTDSIRKLRKIAEICKKDPKYLITDKLYKLLYDPKLYELAYQKLKSKPGNMTPGITHITLDGMSETVIKEIIMKLRNRTFEFSPGRRIYIPKANGGKRPLTIAPPRDKIVQEAIRMILEAIYEPSFAETSHGFRPGKSCHTALKEAKTKFGVAA